MKIFFLMFNILSSYRVVWNNIKIDIPLNSSPGEYFNLPEAKLIDDKGNIVSKNCFYEEVNHTTTKVINTKHVKTFRVDYKATFPDYFISNTESIYFNIVDTIAPEFIYVEDIIEPVGKKLLDKNEIISNIIYKDNYYSNDDITINIYGLSLVNVNIPGKYKITIEIFDPSYNINKVERYYIIESNKKPIIESKDIIYHEYGLKFDPIKHFKITDPYDNNLEIKYDYNFDFNHLGSFYITVKATNKFGLFETSTRLVEVIDSEKPQLIIKENNVFNVYDYDKKVLESLIIEVSDNYSKLNINSVIIEGYIDFNSIGKYECIYKVSDSSLNMTSKKVIIEIKDLEKPSINILTDIIIEVNKKYIDYHNYFLIEDNYDDYSDLIIKFIDINIKYDIIGTYNLDVSVTDKSKNTKIIKVKVLVKDLEAPEVFKINDELNIIFTDFNKVDNNYYKKFFEINDNYDKGANINLELIGEINYKKPGIYNVIFRFTDSSLNYIELSDTIYVIDENPPELILSKNNITLKLNSSEPDYLTFIEKYSDNLSLPENILIKIKSKVNINEIGVYEVIYELTDEYENISQYILLVYVDLKYEKLISGKDLSLNKNDIFYKGMNLELGENVVSLLSFPKNIDTSISGTYHILYVAYDCRGNYEEYIQKVEIADNSINYKKYYLVALFNIIAITGFIIYYYKKK
ncbi:hypothetical protein [Haploplasma modicum]|uniref:hypothetical protein n=1 Tax=Haploplasma modicum TaxID=2150 RepID=UPI00047BCD34|nr:hypothetical protein [Haploplasma modicum]